MRRTPYVLYPRPNPDATDMLKIRYFISPVNFTGYDLANNHVKNSVFPRQNNGYHAYYECTTQ